MDEKRYELNQVAIKSTINEWINLNSPSFYAGALLC